MTDERWRALMADEELHLTPEEIKEGWHWCYDFDGLLRNNNEEDFKCDCNGKWKDGPGSAIDAAEYRMEDR